MKTLEEVQVGLEKDSIQVILEEMSKAVVGPDQVWEWVLLGIGLDVLNVGSMIILPKTVQIYWIHKKEQSEQIQQLLNLEEDKTALKVLMADTYLSH